ncbi:TPA: helix-turn-helix transcriptional regulator [Pseudomonas aeruginosa]|uniref:XRE family transcriptional regulator n=1 Tax=Pseudomonas monteilii TaxID=76759 RepID=A0AAP7KD90_9PSED|nr:MULTISPECIES: helix-turn-helix transcriptional regulator [Pseudomonas]HEH8490290.1 helix-turn-helix transcriptional regulator [Pseudomonas aeruginosa]MCO7535319.1 helix-turn-helix domain-containing protein [Pseudomonas asiatica]MCO7548180.1 helix-turn-helix domain-containing protein [Pseudomonas asiatica]MCO7559051.1 helix-turn-helix domain-containing protein [Pseudomonas asiatica]OAH42041.1 XRE family transcriptional regulator [Pseudomonas monteilii]|tara:strand:- start:335 stop:631 length:297 start_codon:yes stop_codon:yes gene_type:complete
MSFMHLLHSPADIARDVGENAKALRLSKNLSRKTLAEKSGVSETTIKRFETTGVVTLEALILLATALDERTAVTKLFRPDHPNSVEELKNANRKRGMR